jgi:hypothetical protein
MGEAKRRREWVAKGGKDWGATGVSSWGRWGSRIHGLSAERIAKLELERTNRREGHKGHLFGLLGFMAHAIGLSKTAISRLSAARGQMKKRGASAAARRSFR